MSEAIENIIIGAGQAGLSISYLLTQRGRQNLILEQEAQVGAAWRSKRWDSFHLVTPNWQLRLPGAEYEGAEPDAFMPRDEVIDYIERYRERFRLPVRCGVKATAVERTAGGYRISTDAGTFEATNVVVATGSFQHPKLPAFAADLAPDITQLHSSRYRNPDALPDGAVLVVGSGQSGCQIADELVRSGRKVYLSVGSAGRLPRRHRGRDTVWWLNKLGFYDRTVDKLPSPAARFAGNPHLTGVRGRTLNLHQFARDGMALLGHIESARGDKIILRPDLKESLAKADKFAADIIKAFDDYIAQNGLDAPPEPPLEMRDGYDLEIIRELDLRSAGISTVLWATGYSFDYSLVKLPVLDPYGYPIHTRGITEHPGLYFVGLHWMHTLKSGLFFGVGDDAAHIVSHMLASAPRS